MLEVRCAESTLAISTKASQGENITMIIAPFKITTRVFQSDDGWSYQIQWWTGPVYTSGEPTGSMESTKAYRTAATAWKAAYNQSGLIVSPVRTK